MDIIGLIKSAFSFLGELFGLVSKRSDLNNSPEVVEMEKRRDEEKAQDEVQKAVRKKDTRKMRDLLGCLLAGSLLVSGCTTVTPGTVKSGEASMDGNAATSGFIGFNEDGSGIITDGARQRYNALIARYGGRFLVPLTKDHGLSESGTAGQWVATGEALEKFAIMNRWFKEGR